MINKKILRLAKKKPIIINTSRGEIVNENDIIWGLKNKLLSGYGTDVIESEFSSINKSSIIKNVKSFSKELVLPVFTIVKNFSEIEPLIMWFFFPFNVQKSPSKFPTRLIFNGK